MFFIYGEMKICQPMYTLTFIVDIFFTISGLLLSYNFLRNQADMTLIRQNTLWKNVKLFTTRLLYRYLRLTPLYLFIIGANEISSSYLDETSLFWIETREDIRCQAYWWRNLLYINNLFPLKYMCVGWSWYLSCEMQFFIFFTLLLFLYAKQPELTKKIFICSFAAFTAIHFYKFYETKYTPANDVMTSTFDQLYTPPWMRIIPYLIGVGSGWLLVNRKHTLDIDKKSAKYSFLAAYAIIIACHNWTIDRSISYTFSSIIITLIRVFYAGSIAWIILASTSTNGAPFAKWLDRKVFVHVNKLSYAIYLLNAVVITFFAGIRDHSDHYHLISMTIMSIGLSVIVYLLAFVCSLLFEVPYNNLSSLIKNYNKTDSKLK